MDDDGDGGCAICAAGRKPAKSPFPPAPVEPPRPPRIGDRYYRAHGFVSDHGDALNVHVSYDTWVVLSVTTHRMRITRLDGFLQPWEGLPGQEGLDDNSVTLTPTQLADRLEGRDVRVSGHDSVRMYAWPTRELALESLKIRTSRRVLHRQRDLDHVLLLQKHLSTCSDPDAAETAWGTFKMTRRT